jgi:hypothetical protein
MDKPNMNYRLLGLNTELSQEWKTTNWVSPTSDLKAKTVPSSRFKRQCPDWSLAWFPDLVVFTYV